MANNCSISLNRSMLKRYYDRFNSVLVQLYYSAKITVVVVAVVVVAVVVVVVVVTVDGYCCYR